MKADGERDLIEPVRIPGMSLGVAVPSVRDVDDNRVGGQKYDASDLAVHTEEVVRGMVEQVELKGASPERECAGQECAKELAREP